MPDGLESLEFTAEFLGDLARNRWQASELAAILKCLRLLSENDRHPSLNVHALKGGRAGEWTAYASLSVRVVFERLPDGRRRLLTLSRHYEE